MQITAENIAALQEQILLWYQQDGRDLPWRHTTDPYCILVSEMMLQQTQVPRVIEKYHVWLAQFPTVEVLAKASPAQVIQAWAGLGYNRRALYLQRAAQVVTAQAQFPTNYADLIALPGIGPYTAAAVCSFAYNQDIALVDTNIKRIYQLIVFGDEAEPTEKQVLTVAQQFLPHGHSKAWHNALMDLGTVLGKERSALKQQQILKSLFPVLAAIEMPLVKDQPLARSKQSPFKQSRRYWRGQIVSLLRTHPQLTTNKVKEILNFPSETTYSFEDVVDSLVRDALILRNGDTIQLPHE